MSRTRGKEPFYGYSGFWEVSVFVCVQSNADSNEKASRIISDMEFDGCATTGAISHDRWGYSRRVAPTPRLFEVIAQRYAEAGYQIPRLVFWNVNSRSGTIPVKENDLGVALVSGFSPNIAKMVMSGQTDPYDCLLEAINAERYQQVDDALRPIISA